MVHFVDDPELFVEETDDELKFIIKPHVQFEEIERGIPWFFRIEIYGSKGKGKKKRMLFPKIFEIKPEIVTEGEEKSIKLEKFIKDYWPFEVQKNDLSLKRIEEFYANIRFVPDVREYVSSDPKECIPGSI